MRPTSSQGSGAYGERVFDVSANNGTGLVTVYDTVGLICGKSYYYSVQPIRQAGGDSYGEKGYVQTGKSAKYDCTGVTTSGGNEGMGGGSSTADAPTNLNVVKSTSFSPRNPVMVGTSFLKMTWSGPSTNYKVYRCAGSTCTNFTNVGDSSDKLHQDFGTAKGTTYRYKVCLSENTSKCSNISSGVR